MGKNKVILHKEDNRHLKHILGVLEVLKNKGYISDSKVSVNSDREDGMIEMEVTLTKPMAYEELKNRLNQIIIED